MNFLRGKNKAVTFSFDDGNADDKRVIEILNKYGLKGTFNLNSGSLSGTSEWNSGRKTVYHINYCTDSDIYIGHEVACHSYRHPHLEKLDEDTLYNEIHLDKIILSSLFHCDVRGMAYPYGTYNDSVIEALKKCGIEYSRTVKSTYSFDLPDNPLVLNPTCHFQDERVTELAEQFLNSESDEPMLFYIWGHSYELVTEEEWQRFENLCRMLSNKRNVCYCTNIEVIDAANNFKNANAAE